jgi:predicted nucleotidyltransferase
MPPTESDLPLGRDLALRIVAAGLGRVRRVVLIGSRARGTARVDSDMDLVVLVEPPEEHPAWGPAEVIAERARIFRQVGLMPHPTELWVRTTDRYEEARSVIGGVERLVDEEGVDLYSRQVDRLPTTRCTPDEVRKQHVSAWMEHALTAFEGTLEMRTAPASSGRDPHEPRTADEAARICAARAVNALLVFHQLAGSKAAGLSGMLALLTTRDRVTAARLQRSIAGERRPVQLARLVVGTVLRKLRDDKAMRPYLASSLTRLAATRSQTV